jgi:subtilisin family serine protease
VPLLPGEDVKNNIRRVGAVTADGRVTDFTSLGVAVAVVDTGIDRRHPDLNVAGGKNFCVTDPTNDPYTDGFGHGTHVAGVIGAKNNGKGIIGAAPGGHRGRGTATKLRAFAAPRCQQRTILAPALLSSTPWSRPPLHTPLPPRYRPSTRACTRPISTPCCCPPRCRPPHAGIPIYSLKVLAADGTGATSDLLRAYEWLYYNARALGIRVVNLSLTGGGGENDPQCEWAAALARQGVTVVAAAGNNKASLMTEAPGACPKALVVSRAVGGAADERQGRKAASARTVCGGSCLHFLCRQRKPSPENTYDSPPSFPVLLSCLLTPPGLTRGR